MLFLLVPFQLNGPTRCFLSRAANAEPTSRGNWSKIVGTALVGLASALAQSPPAPAGSPRLTLQSALELAAKQNLDLAAARERRAVTLAGIRIARQRPNPTANFTALRDTPHEGVFIDQPLELGSKRRRRIEVAEQESRLTDVEIETVARQVRRNVREGYIGALFSRAESERRRGTLKLAERLEEIARERYEAGAVAQLEVIQAQLAVARARADLQVARQEEKVSLSQLNALLNEPATTAWDLQGSIGDLPPRPDLPELIDRAYASNAGLQHLAQEQQVEERRHALLKAERVPNVELEFGTDFNSPRDFSVGPRSQLSFMLPIFTRNQGQIAESRARQRVLEAQTQANRRAVAGRVEAVYYELSARRAQVELFRQDLLPATQRVEQLAEESYRAGKSSILTLLDAQRNVQQVEREYLESERDLQTAFAELEETVGAPLD